MNQSDYGSGSLARKTLRVMLVVVGGTMFLTSSLSAAAFFVVGHVAGGKVEAQSAAEPELKKPPRIAKSNGG